MHRTLMLFVCSFALATAGALSAAPTLPVISITQVEAKDADTYATWIARLNEVMKTKTGNERTFRIYSGDAAGPDSGALFAVSAAESFSALAKNARVHGEDPEAAAVRLHMNAIREMGPRVLAKAVRFDGTHPGGHLYNHWVAVGDEAAYVKALDALRALFDAHDLKDVKINAYRVVAGRTDATHLVSLNAPNAERQAAVLDAVAGEAWVAEWFATTAKIRTVVRNGTYHEITR